MLNLNDLRLFVAAVQDGGFAAASRRLGVPKSTISKRVAELEKSLTVRLVNRTSRNFTLTDVGQDFHRHARATLIEAEAAEEVVHKRLAEPSGTVRIAASVPTAQLYLAELLPHLAETHPRLHLQLDVSDRFVDVVREGIDIAVRDHYAPLPDSELVQRPVSTDRIILVASPDYLRRQEALRHPADLSAHDGLLIGPTAHTWHLSSKTGEEIQVTPGSRMVANESVLLINAALAGLGIACLPGRMCRKALNEGTLVRVLSDWHAGSVTTTLLMPHRRGQLPGVRAAVEFLVRRLGEP